MRRLLLMAAVLTLTSCIHTTPEVSKSPDRTPQNTRTFLDGIDQITADINDPGRFNANTCGAYLEDKVTTLFNRPFDYYNPKTEQEIAEFSKKSLESINKIFKIRLTLKEKLKEFLISGQLTSSTCIASTRKALMVARSVEDMTMLWLSQKNLLPTSDGSTFGGGSPHTLKNPKFFKNDSEKVEFKSGDVIMMRGFAVVSALIGRIGDEKGMFSHVGIVYIDPATQKTFILESLIEGGYVATPLDVWMKEAQRRTVLLRHPDANLAANAAKALYDYANRKRTIPYDFAMNLDSYDKMFCAEVVRFAYDKASDGKIMIPTFQTSFAQSKTTGFLDLMGITATTTFSPNDMDIEPRFDVVAEFRSIQNTPKLRLQDAAMESMFEWMKSKDYRLHFDVTERFKVFATKILHDLGLDGGKVPDGMSRKVLMTMIKLRHLQGEILFKHISEYEANFLKEKGLYPSYQDILGELERFRSEDCNAYFKKENGPPKRAVFHQFFRSNSSACAVAN